MIIKSSKAKFQFFEINNYFDYFINYKNNYCLFLHLEVFITKPSNLKLVLLKFWISKIKILILIQKFKKTELRIGSRNCTLITNYQPKNTRCFIPAQVQWVIIVQNAIALNLEE